MEEYRCEDILQGDGVHSDKQENQGCKRTLMGNYVKSRHAES